MTLYEKEKELGGRFRAAAVPPKRGEIREFIDYLVRSVRSLGVKIETGIACRPAGAWRPSRKDFSWGSRSDHPPEPLERARPSKPRMITGTARGTGK